MTGCPDGIYYVDVQNCWTPEARRVLPKALHVGMFTHLHTNDPRNFRQGWDQLDGVVHMASRYLEMFVEQCWYRRDQMALIRPGEVAADFPLKPVTFGVCQRGEHEGKGRDFLAAVIESLPVEIKAAMRLSFIGKGWLPDDEAGSGDAQAYHGVASYLWPEKRALYARWHQQIDYLLIPSLWEGGPCSLLEALATGTEVITADVGWVPELTRGLQGIWTFGAGNEKSLRAILTSFVGYHLDRRRAVEGMSYRKYAEDVLAFFEVIQGRQAGP
jgi:hypothetical protein